MAQEQQDKAQLPGAGENWAEKEEGHTNTPKTDAEHRSNVIALLEAKGLNTTRFVEMKFFGGSAAIKPPYKPLPRIWETAPISNHETEFTVTRWAPGLSAGFINPATGSQQADSPISSLGEASSNAVQRAQEKLKKAQQELREALDVERAMLHLAQLQTVQRAHKELYGLDPETGLTAAQEYSAFKQAQREQQSK
ncbi:MAG: hypothetical protein EOO61_05350 [Hymenobacter sp.]|nr:MAG: hypothetical protein EOO61_05350 [Hymenobacter sp.]